MKKQPTITLTRQGWDEKSLDIIALDHITKTIKYLQQTRRQLDAKIRRNKYVQQK